MHNSSVLASKLSSFFTCNFILLSFLLHIMHVINPQLEFAPCGGIWVEKMMALFKQHCMFPFIFHFCMAIVLFHLELLLWAFYYSICKSIHDTGSVFKEGRVSMSSQEKSAGSLCQRAVGFKKRRLIAWQMKSGWADSSVGAGMKEEIKRRISTGNKCAGRRSRGTVYSATQ